MPANQEMFLCALNPHWKIDFIIFQLVYTKIERQELREPPAPVAGGVGYLPKDSALWKYS